MISPQVPVLRSAAGVWTLAVMLAACAPTLDQQKAWVQAGDLRLEKIQSRAVLDAWGQATYEYKDFIQFYRLTNGQHIPQFRVPLGEAPNDWDSSADMGVGYFLIYADRGQIMGFLEDRLVYFEKLPAETLHEIGRVWQREKQFRPQRAIIKR